MAVRKQKDQQIRKLIRLGKNSLVVSLPILIVQKLGWKEKQKVVVKKVGRKLVIYDWPRR
ncbi:MAG: hypothetical protein A2660_00885 [Candidatus Doudnabacteria bacterium RIFCSPHIGHO2_01_FULL_45_18]|uniref:SpoVT-AbrB domain-containing protein n=1 Tax=Candidatus Doudnabacteria bacterium RIFCSPHIGHO2_01_FULL_45_18 TaxID=1817823 RepID=A0A1F5NRP1_9BACT|nr:MAG: hypothetical protein A2660_00885 [Candidatus Doudnabacteria bacterium RIFCSPHIGHO2_01_FULL_45_18]